jgi:hypothetical protein
MPRVLISLGAQLLSAFSLGPPVSQDKGKMQYCCNVVFVGGAYFTSAGTALALFLWFL